MIRLKDLITEQHMDFDSSMKSNDSTEHAEPDINYKDWELVDEFDGVMQLIAAVDGKYYMAQADPAGGDVGITRDTNIYDIEEIDKGEYLKLGGEYSNQTNNQAPQDKVIDIKGSEPYYTVIYRHEGKNYKIEFEDYELMDQVDDYAWSGELLGVDDEGGEWAVMCQAVTLGGGDYDWEVDWDTVQYQGIAKPKTDNKNIDIDEKEDLIFNLWDRIIDNDRQGIEKGISDNGVKFDFDTSVVDNAEFKEFRKELETMLGPWRHKVYPGSKDLVVIELYENKMKLKDLIPEQIRNNIDSEDKDFDIIANHVNYEGKYLSSIPFDDQVMSKDFVEETIQEILDDIESGNRRDPETGEYQYDVDRLTGNIEFDCTIPIQGFEIDLRIEYDENADIVSINVQDADIADKFGITDDVIDKKLS